VTVAVNLREYPFIAVEPSTAVDGLPKTAIVGVAGEIAVVN
jgi:hypothetical protein